MVGALLAPEAALGILAGRRPPSVSRVIGIVLVCLVVLVAGAWLLLGATPWFLMS